MLDVRVENEIKMYGSAGPFAYEGGDPSAKLSVFRSVFEEAGFSVSDTVCSVHTDYYYTDTEGKFDAENVLLRYRDLGAHALLTIKLPSIRNGLGLSRREIEGDILNDSRFDRWKSVRDYAREFYGPVEIGRQPRLKVDVVRGGCRIRSDVRGYTFTFDKIVYTDPATGKRSKPCYELEFESLDEAIVEDKKMQLLLNILSDKYAFEEERVSKYARGIAFLKSLAY